MRRTHIKGRAVPVHLLRRRLMGASSHLLSKRPKSYFFISKSVYVSIMQIPFFGLFSTFHKDYLLIFRCNIGSFCLQVRMSLSFHFFSFFILGNIPRTRPCQAEPNRLLRLEPTQLSESIHQSMEKETKTNQKQTNINKV